MLNPNRHLPMEEKILPNSRSSIWVEMVLRINGLPVSLKGHHCTVSVLLKKKIKLHVPVLFVLSILSTGGPTSWACPLPHLPSPFFFFFFFLISVHPTVCCHLSISTTAFSLLAPVSLLFLGFSAYPWGFFADEGFHPKYSFSLFFLSLSHWLRASTASPCSHLPVCIREIQSTAQVASGQSQTLQIVTKGEHWHYSLAGPGLGAGWCIDLCYLDQACVRSFTSLSLQTLHPSATRPDPSRQQMTYGGCRGCWATLSPSPGAKPSTARFRPAMAQCQWIILCSAWARPRKFC